MNDVNAHIVTGLEKNIEMIATGLDIIAVFRRVSGDVAEVVHPHEDVPHGGTRVLQNVGIDDILGHPVCVLHLGDTHVRPTVAARVRVLHGLLRVTDLRDSVNLLCYHSRRGLARAAFSGRC